MPVATKPCRPSPTQRCDSAAPLRGLRTRYGSACTVAGQPASWPVECAPPVVPLERVDIRRRVLPENDEPNHGPSALELAAITEISGLPTQAGSERAAAFGHASLRQSPPAVVSSRQGSHCLDHPGHDEVERNPAPTHDLAHRQERKAAQPPPGIPPDRPPAHQTAEITKQRQSRAWAGDQGETSAYGQFGSRLGRCAASTASSVAARRLHRSRPYRDRIALRPVAPINRRGA